MNKAELIEALADKTGLQKQEAKKVLDAYIEIVTERMSENEEIDRTCRIWNIDPKTANTASCQKS